MAYSNQQNWFIGNVEGGFECEHCREKCFVHGYNSDWKKRRYYLCPPCSLDWITIKTRLWKDYGHDLSFQEDYWERLTSFEFASKHLIKQL